VSAVDKYWNSADCDLSYQFSRSVEDGKEKTRRAIADGADTILVVGGDGMVNSIGSELVGTDVALGVIPAGSGNGFARHFGIPLNIGHAAEALYRARRQWIDVGTANGRPFFVTCGMAADAELVRRFEKSPVRGVLPYVFAAAYELFEYHPQPFSVTLDGDETMNFNDVLVFTVANLTQFGGGARIAPHACPDDGHLEMVVVQRQDIARFVAGISRLFSGTIDKLPGVVMRRFQRLDVHRQKPAAIQVDGELVEAPAEVTVRVRRKALQVLVPGPG
jgi:YegS/Rv2252/BmrU family lipid kinase